jgi:phosphoribosylamine--glycine ligase
MRVLVVGQGGREHALCTKIAQSPLCDELFCAPGNAGIAEIASCAPVPVDDTAGLINLCKEKGIDFVVVGPEDPLVAGLADELEANGFPTFGPSKLAARLEGSKSFTKEFCEAYNIPTAAFGKFTDAGAAKSYIQKHGVPVVVKADGLAAGKGVTIAQTFEEASQAIDDALTDDKFGNAGHEIVIEEFMSGKEFSFFAFVDGTHILPLATAQDYKRVGDGDQGPNTGGMGATSPAMGLPQGIEKEIISKIIEPTVQGMQKIGSPFKGILYAGIMLTDGGPKLIEYNVRFGDPECQAMLMRMDTDLLPILIAAREGKLSQFDLSWDQKSTVCIVMAADGYPESPKRGTAISGLSEAGATDPDVKIFHAATQMEGKRLVANGGRVLNIVAHAPTIAEARSKAYAVVDKINWPEGFYRRDIAASPKVA